MKILITLFLSVFMFSACGGATTNDSASAQTAQNEVKQVSVEQTNEAVKSGNVQFIDVRTKEEFGDKHAPKAINMPLDSFESELAKLDKNIPVYVICQSGARSQKAAEMLQKSAFKEIYNVKGGTSAWISAGLPTEK